MSSCEKPLENSHSRERGFSGSAHALFLSVSIDEARIMQAHHSKFDVRSGRKEKKTRNQVFFFHVVMSLVSLVFY